MGSWLHNLKIQMKLNVILLDECQIKKDFISLNKAVYVLVVRNCLDNVNTSKFILVCTLQEVLEDVFRFS